MRGLLKARKEMLPESFRGKKRRARMLLKRIGKSSKESSKRCQLNSKESRRSKKNLRQIWLSCVKSTQNR